MMTLIVRQSSQQLFGSGAAASVLLMLVMFVWVGVCGAPSAATWRPPHDRADALAARAGA